MIGRPPDHPRKVQSSTKIIVLSILSLVLAGCSTGRGAEGPIHDGRGLAVTTSPPLTRIVSTAPNMTGILVRLGLGKRLVGISAHCDQPDPAQPLLRMGGLVGPDAERIASLSPQLLVASYEGNPPQMGDTIRALKIPLYVARIDSLDSLDKTMLDLELLILGTNSALLRTSLSNTRSKIRGCLTGLRVFLQIGTSSQAWTFGRSSLIHDALTLAGAINLGAERKGNFPHLDAESMASLKPDLIVLLSGHQFDRDRAFWKRHAPQARLLTPEPSLFEQPGPWVAQAIQVLAAP
jgi:iron complex transport system substrate-binding protein